MIDFHTKIKAIVFGIYVKICQVTYSPFLNEAYCEVSLFPWKMSQIIYDRFSYQNQGYGLWNSWENVPKKIMVDV